MGFEIPQKGHTRARKAHDKQGILAAHVHCGLKIVAKEPHATGADIHADIN